MRAKCFDQLSMTTILKTMFNDLFNRKPEDKPFLISGPCSAETEEQVLETCQRLAATGKVQALRAGIWKPRTKPGGFEGVGAKGLPWLKKAACRWPWK
jgi:chorismate mutase